ncbi:MAG: diguanylate cyclase [Candidatus Sumerlaeota bacterium]|nr:diguanylate cyclase [Candidatus Sumerlaeota bacterium]
MSREVEREKQGHAGTGDAKAAAPQNRGESSSEITESTTLNNLLRPASGVFESRLFRPVLICLTGSQRGQRRSLTGATIVIGRSMGCEWQLEDTAASRQHVRIEYENFKSSSEMPRCFITDMGSRNGTQVNGHEINGRTPLRERDRILIGSTVIGFFVRDEGELRHDESLYLSATSDVLTGLDNRRQLRVHLRHQLARARRQYRPVSFLLLDLDHFKNINDQFGHDVGDEALRHIAQVLRNGVREGDLVARWGGEEFAICLPETDIREGAMLADRIRHSIEITPLEVDGHEVRMTTSIGVTAYRPGDGADSLFQRADHMLYQAKEKGRNRVEIDAGDEEIHLDPL